MVYVLIKPLLPEMQTHDDLETFHFDNEVFSAVVVADHLIIENKHDFKKIVKILNINFTLVNLPI